MRTKKLTDAQRVMLGHLAQGRGVFHGLRGRSEFGGATRTFTTLTRQELLHTSTQSGKIYITSWGRVALREGRYTVQE